MEYENCHTWIDADESVYIKEDGSEQVLCWECAKANFQRSEQFDDWDW